MNITVKIFPLVTLLAAMGCVHQNLPQATMEQRSAASFLKAASVITASPAERAGQYLAAASEAQQLLHLSSSSDAARVIYNKATVDLAVLLRTADHGKMWNRPQKIACGDTTWNLRFSSGHGDGSLLDPNRFSAILAASDISNKIIKRKNYQTGLGGALVGIHRAVPREAFSPLVGVSQPITAVLDFKGRDVTLSLYDPNAKPQVSLAGESRSLDADFSAPLSYYPVHSELFNGLMGAISVSKYVNLTGLYMLEPYDDERIPLIFVHGLISTPQMWRNVINEINADPELRKRYQCGVFGYPTGYAPAIAALNLRQELAKFYRVHPKARDCMLVGHSMGGIVSRMQATTVDRSSWNVVGKSKYSSLFSRIKNDSPVERMLVFQANPHVGRLVFICTPHRGSELALSSLGDIGKKLISLPVDLTAKMTSTMGDAVGMITGDAHIMPNSVTALSPANPMLKVLDSRPMSAPYHTILGDRSKGDSPNSSDGVVQYWSSHLEGAKSQKIVPGPHGSCELPETITELRRIMHLHLNEQGVKR